MNNNDIEAGSYERRKKLSEKTAQMRLREQVKPLIEVNHLQKSFTVGKVKVRALADVSFTVKAGEFIAISGVSGAGKSTLLHMLGGLDRPSAGAIEIAGHNLVGMTEDEITSFRKENIGFVFQFFNLIPTLTAFENVIVSHMFDTVAEQDEIWNDAEELLKRMGLGKRLEHRPGELSGGEQQRVAIAGR
jgi:ABC-type lipoprotein export system ATPase subunit